MTELGPAVPARPLDHDSLREAFAHEVSQRLPLMTVAAAGVGAEGDLDSARELARHAHTLASSAAVVGEDLASQHARRCELALAPFLEPDADAVAVSDEAVRIALAELATLSVLLAPWLVGDADGE